MERDKGIGRGWWREIGRSMVWGDEEDGRRCWWGRGDRKWIGVRIAGEMRVLKKD